MIEATVIGYLSGIVELPPVFAERPEDPPAEYLLVECVGGGTNNHLRTAMIAIQSYADSLFRAAEINELVEAAMDALTDLDSVSRCKINSSYNYTDTDSRKYRYQAIFDIVYY